VAFRPALIARIPLTFILRFDAHTVHQKISGPADPCYARENDNVLSSRHNVLKSGTAQSNPINFSRLLTNPAVYGKGKPNSTFAVNQVWIAALL
jgi:hypothetical protein